MTGPVLTMAEAARTCGVSVSTLRRHRDALMTYGATRHDASWAIPVSALVALGLMPRVTPSDAPTTAHAPPVTTSPEDGVVEALKAERDQALHQAADAKRRAETAERIATERDRVIEAQSYSLRLLEPGRTQSATPPVTETPIDNDRPVSKWRRLFTRLRYN